MLFQGWENIQKVSSDTTKEETANLAPTGTDALATLQEQSLGLKWSEYNPPVCNQTRARVKLGPPHSPCTEGPLPAAVKKKKKGPIAVDRCRSSCSCHPSALLIDRPTPPTRLRRARVWLQSTSNPRLEGPARGSLSSQFAAVWSTSIKDKFKLMRSKCPGRALHRFG